MILVKANKDSEAGEMPSEQLLTEMGRYNEKLVKAGVLLAGDGLQASSTGARIRYADGKFTVTDGPFIESKELVAGYWLVQVKSKAEAIEWAKRVPIQKGEVEIRPLFEMADVPVDPAEKPAAPPARKPGTIRYMGLLKADPDTEAGVIPDEKVIAAVGEFMEEGVKSGVFLSGEGLQPSSEAARVRYSKDKRTVIDGPFTETKELIAGFVIIQVRSKEEAIEWAKRFVQLDAPGRYAAQSEIEIRPFFELEDFVADTAEKPHGWRQPEQRLRTRVSERH
jgi:hypothetical protein